MSHGGRMDKVISLDTLLPVSLVAILAGGIFWLSSMFATVQSNALAVIELKESVRSTDNSRAEYRQRLWEAIRAQDKRLAVIEGKLDVIAELVTELVTENNPKDIK